MSTKRVSLAGVRVSQTVDGILRERYVKAKRAYKDQGMHLSYSKFIQDILWRYIVNRNDQRIYKIATENFYRNPVKFMEGWLDGDESLDKYKFD